MQYFRVAIVLFVAALVASMLGFPVIEDIADDCAKALVLVGIILLMFTFESPKPPPLSPA